MAGLMLLSGLGLLLWWAKPTSYYLNSEYFAVKMAFFTFGSLWIVLTKIWMAALCALRSGHKFHQPRSGVACALTSCA